MEVQNALSELYALKQLYGLLQMNAVDDPNASYKLDEGARILLKKLLDGATENVLEVCSKITEAQSSRRKNSRWSSLLDAVQKLKPFNLQYSQDASFCKNNPEEELNRHTIASSEPRLCQKDGLELSEFSVSKKRYQSETEHCSICQKCGRKQKLATETETLISDISPKIKGRTLDRADSSINGNVMKMLEQKEKAIVAVEGNEISRQESVHELPSNSTCIKPLASSSGLPAAGNVKPLGSTDGRIRNEKLSEHNDFIAEVTNTIKGLDSYISSLKVCSGFVEDVKHQVAQHSLSSMYTSGVVKQMKEDSVTEIGSSGAGDSMLNGNKGLVRLTSGRTRKDWVSSNQNMDTDSMHGTIRIKGGHDLEDSGSLMKNTDAPSLLEKKNYPPRNSADSIVRGVGLQSQKNTQAYRQSMKDIVLHELGSQTNSWSQSDDIVYGLRVPLSQNNRGRKARESIEYQNQKMIEDVTAKARTPFLPHTADPGKSTAAKKPILRRKNMKHQVMLRPTLLDYMSTDSAWGPSSYKYQIGDRKRSGKQRKGNVVSQGKISQYEQESDEFDSSSSSSSRETEQSSWTTEQTSGSVSGSETNYSSSQASGSQSESSSYASVASSRLMHEGSDSSSEDSNSLSAADSKLGSAKHSDGMTSRRYRSGHRPAAGRLRRLKDKLALIFHHHHHHHHHYNNDKKQTIVNTGHKTSTGKQVRGIFNHRKNAKKGMRGGVQRKSRSVVKKVNNTDHQVGQFHGLVQGLMRYIHHSKTSNPSKPDTRKFGNRYRGQNKKGAKVHWWKVIRHHRKNQPKRGRVKIVMPKKKQRLITNY